MKRRERLHGGLRVPRLSSRVVRDLAANYAIALDAPVGSERERTALYGCAFLIGAHVFPRRDDALRAQSVSGLCAALADCARVSA